MAAKVARPFIDYGRSYSAGDDFIGDAARIERLAAHGLVEAAEQPEEPRKQKKKGAERA